MTSTIDNKRIITDLIDRLFSQGDTSAVDEHIADGFVFHDPPFGVTPDKEVIAHCQTHNRSSHSWMVMKVLGYPRAKGYDGSWSEWGNDPETPVET